MSAISSDTLSLTKNMLGLTSRMFFHLVADQLQFKHTCHRITFAAWHNVPCASQVFGAGIDTGYSCRYRPHGMPRYKTNNDWGLAYRGVCNRCAPDGEQTVRYAACMPGPGDRYTQIGRSVLPVQSGGIPSTQNRDVFACFTCIDILLCCRSAACQPVQCDARHRLCQGVRRPPHRLCLFFGMISHFTLEA
jgi:hypothetical protein